MTDNCFLKFFLAHKYMLKTQDESTEIIQQNLLNFIQVKFISPIKINDKSPSIRQYEKITSIGRATIDKLTKSSGYDVPISTIYKICKFSKISLKEFFTLFEEYENEIETKENY